MLDTGQWLWEYLKSQGLSQDLKRLKCGKRFKRSSDLSKPRRSHLYNRPYHYPDCGTRLMSLNAWVWQCFHGTHQQSGAVSQIQK
ncbi:hypothetical protein Y1Q_0022349 [Alligator mississippiensis]|uniref:Uncharacterized protein n=1 Tax=Alligator mississippiensis TaxID=8496 RepID=A0A151LYG4_ALLMI|nr:hypothetical protein Y1Q_0022349 [Alligator mississippiensis]